jgi:glycosyltransferase involved in cell wall biosynthesis
VRELKVLIGMPDPTTRSGPNACEPPFVEALRSLGVDVVETTYVYGDNLERTPLATRVRRVVRTAGRVRRVARAERFDLVHLSTSFDTRTVLRDAFTLTLLGRSTPPVFLKLHGSDPMLLTSGGDFVRTLARYVLGRAAAIGVLSSTERDAFVAAGVPAEKLSVVLNAMPAQFATTQSREAFLSSHGLPRETPLLLFISRLIRSKGLLDAIRACALLRDRGKPSVLCCVGDGPARSEAEAESARLGVESAVRFFGYLPEFESAAFYRHSDVLVFPTQNEGLAIVLLNALAAGLPIVTTRIRGAKDHLVEPDTCLWVEPHRPDQIAERVETLLDNDELRAAMGKQAREKARTFAPTAVAREYLQLYERLLAIGSVSRDPEFMLASRVDSDAEAPL